MKHFWGHLVINYLTLLFFLKEKMREVSAARILKHMDSAILMNHSAEAGEANLSHIGQQIYHHADIFHEDGEVYLKHYPQPQEEKTARIPTPQEDEEILMMARASGRVLSRKLGANQQEAEWKMHHILRKIYVGYLEHGKINQLEHLEYSGIKMSTWKYLLNKKLFKSGNYKALSQEIIKEKQMIQLEDALHSIYPQVTKTEMKYFKSFASRNDLSLKYHRDPVSFQNKISDLWEEWKASKDKRSLEFKLSTMWERFLNCIEILSHNYFEFILGTKKKSP